VKNSAKRQHSKRILSRSTRFYSSQVHIISKTIDTFQLFARLWDLSHSPRCSCGASKLQDS